MANNGEVSFNVTKSIWRLNAAVNGWQKEVNLVAWNNNKPKIDIRDWNSDKTKMKKGLSLNKDEVLELKRCLNTINIDKLFDDSPKAIDENTGPGPMDTGAHFVIASTKEEPENAIGEED
ncbi:MAG: hypothetical protein E7388_00955 [Ruminococcaceae bacterium]|nr:hypothetical protein [Oscillospiraceae bacterium]